MTVIADLPIRTKFAVVMTAILAVVSALTFIYVPDRLRRLGLDGVMQKAAALAEMTGASTAAAVSAGDRIQAAEALTTIRRDPDLVYLMVVDSSGQPFAVFNDRVASHAGYRALRTQPVRGATKGAFTPDGQIYQAVAPLRYHGQQVGTAYIGVSTQHVREQIARSRGLIAVVAVIAFGIGVIAVFGFSTFITGPLRRIVDATERIAAGDLSRRVDVHGRDEVGQLARSFNGMVDEIATLNRTLENRVEERTRELRNEVAERRRAEQALISSEERYRLLYERNLAGVYIAAGDGTILTCNEACARIFGYESTEEFFAGAATIPYRNPHDRESILRRLREDTVVSNEEVELQGRDGNRVWVIENIRLVPGGGLSEFFLEGIILDISDRKRAEIEIAYKAYHDGLTGLPNRALLLERMKTELLRAQRDESQVALMFLDLDDMKSVNDTFGHASGDQLLTLVAQRLSEALRVTDTVARVGGDEFLILLPEIGTETALNEIAEKVRASLADPFALEGDELFVTASIGVSVYPSDGSTPDELIRCADGAMYRVKQAGGDGFQLSSRLGRVALGRLSLEQEIRAAMARDEFVPHYQPQVRIGDRKLSGAEALVRWKTEDGTIVGPAGFIAVAEQTGIITQLGELVLRKACLQLVGWDEAGLHLPHIAVNVSARQFHQRDFIGMVRTVIEETKIDPKRLTLEITETVAMQKSERSVTVLGQLRDLGISIAMDDFGTGQTSLSYLKQFPIDAVKLDRSFVHNIGRNASDEWIVTAVLMLSTQLNLRTIAEGVESEEQCAFLEKHGCNDAQGYLISRPVTAEAFAGNFLRPDNVVIHPAAVPRRTTLS